MADERGMGVLGFADLLDRKAPAGLEWTFERRIDENHGSVGLPSLRAALRAEFEGMQLTSRQFYALEGPDQVVAHFRELGERRGTTFLLPPRLLGNVLNFYLRQDLPEEPKVLEAAIAEHFPESLPLLRMALASHHLEQEEWQPASDLYTQVLENHPNAYSAWAGAALADAGLGHLETAENRIRKAIELAESRGARKWQINQLKADRRKIASRGGSATQGD